MDSVAYERYQKERFVEHEHICRCCGDAAARAMILARTWNPLEMEGIAAGFMMIGSACRRQFLGRSLIVLR